MAPYDVCCVGDCTEDTVDTHHEPGKGMGLLPFDYDNPRFQRKMCRRHHEEREGLGYDRFKEKYLGYDGISITQYRAEKRRERKGGVFGDGRKD